MKHSFLWALALLCPAYSAGCSSSGEPGASENTFPVDPFMTTLSDSGKLRIEVRTAPTQPPPRGIISVELVVSDISGSAVDGLAASMVPWMPAMGHGTSIVPTITPKGSGRYVATQVSLFMPGEWQLRTSFTGSASDHVAPSFDVQ